MIGDRVSLFNSGGVIPPRHFNGLAPDVLPPFRPRQSNCARRHREQNLFEISEMEVVGRGGDRGRGHRSARGRGLRRLHARAHRSSAGASGRSGQSLTHFLGTL